MFYFLMLLIAGVWAAFLLPPAIENRRRSPLSSTEQFSKLTHHLGRARDGNTDTPEVAAAHEALAAGVERDDVLVRRQRILIGLGSLVAITLVAAIAARSVQMLALNLIADAGLVWYVMMLLQIKSRQATATSVVDIRPLPASETPQFRVISNR